MMTRQVLIVILVALNLSIAKKITGQTSKVGIVNLDSLRSQSVVAEWERNSFDIEDWQQQGVAMVEALQNKYLQIQKEIETSLCYGSKTMKELELSLEQDRRKILKFERKTIATKKILSREINKFLLQQIMLLLPDARSDLDFETLSTSSPIYMDDQMGKAQIYVTQWFMQAFKNRPSVLEDWLSFQQNILGQIENGRW